MKKQISSIAVIAIIGLSIFTFPNCSKETCKSSDAEITNNFFGKLLVQPSE